MHFDLYSGVGFHLAGGGMEGIKIHGAIHALPLIIELPKGLPGCSQGKFLVCPNVFLRKEVIFNMSVV